MEAGIKNYMGLIDEGVAVMVTINHEDQIYEAIYWYDDEDHQVLTVRKDLEELIKSTIEEHPDYIGMMKNLKEKVSPIEEITKTLKRIA